MNKIQNILMVYPQVPSNTYWSFKYALRFIHKKSAMPPLGLVTIAALFPKDSYNLKLVDMNIEPLSDKDIKEADAVFISAMIVQKDSMADVITKCNRFNKIVVAGGPYATSSMLEIQGVDHFLLGEVDNNFKNFLLDLEAGKAKKIYPAPEKPDISNLPVPRFDLLKMEQYSCMAVQYSRGCPFHCEFCDIWKVYGNRPRLKNAETLISELDRLHELGWKGPVFVVDDNFIGNKRRVKRELLPALIKWQVDHKFVFRFFTEASINLADDEKLMEGMRDSGFNEVFIGVETPSTESLRETGKVQNLKSDLLTSIITIQKHGMEVMAGFILGFDSDTEDIFDRQVDFIQKAGIPKAMIGMLTALPGTALFSRLEKEGRILSKTGGNNTHCFTTNFKTKMDPEILSNGYKNVLTTIYDKNLKNYFARCNNFLDNLGDSPYFERKVGIKEIIMLLKSISYQPFTSYGFQYMKFVVRNFLKKPGVFGEVIKYGIMGHHFHVITQETLKIDKVSYDLDKAYNYFKEQISRCSVAIRESSLGAIKPVSDLWNQKNRIFIAIKAKMDRINVDFRKDIAQKYNEISDGIRDLLKTYENDFKSAEDNYIKN